MSTQPSVLDIPEDVFRHQVYEVISRELGLLGYARFLRTFCSGKGDYTGERHQWQEGLTLEDIARDLGITMPQSNAPSLTAPPKS